MKTKANEKFPEIDWEVENELLYDDIDERMEVYLAYGEDKDGGKYSGSAYYYCGIFEQISDIEKL